MSAGILIHAPREGSDGPRRSSSRPPRRFLSTLPARGATIDRQIRRLEHIFLSTLPARGATACLSGKSKDRDYFYPRSPRGERQVGLSRAEVANIISIHAPREGSDVASHPPASWPPHFYPRSPRGERPWLTPGGFCLGLFLSTLPARGATSKKTQDLTFCQFLSTLPARGATARRGRV